MNFYLKTFSLDAALFHVYGNVKNGNTIQNSDQEIKIY